MSQLAFDDKPEPTRPYYELQVQPNPKLLEVGNYITQFIGASCAYCGEPLEIEEKIDGMQSVTVATIGNHYDVCAAYRAARVTVDDADGNLPIGRDVQAVAPRLKKKAA